MSTNKVPETSERRILGGVAFESQEDDSGRYVPRFLGAPRRVSSASNMQRHYPVNEPIGLVATMGFIQNGYSVVP